MPKTLAEINKILGDEIAADLTAIIAAVKAAVTSSYEGILADKDAEIVAARAKCDQDLSDARDAMQKQLDDAIAPLTKENKELKSRLAGVEAKLSDPNASIEDVKAEHAKTARERVSEELQKQIDELTAKKAEVEASPAPPAE